MAPRDKALKGVQLLKEAIIEELERADQPLTHAEIVSRLGIHSDYEGKNRNYLSWSVLGLLLKEGTVTYEGERQRKVYSLRR